MSGEKAGSVPSPSAALELLIGPAALIGGAGLCIGLAARGMFRLSKKTYELIDEKIEKAVAGDIKKKLDDIKRFNLSDEEKEKNSQMREAALPRSGNDENLDDFFHQMEQFADDRQEIEKKENFDPIVSNQFKDEIANFKKKLEKKVKSRKVHSSNKNNERDEINTLKEQIYEKLDRIDIFMPVFAKKTSERIKNMTDNKRNYKKILKSIDEKFGLISNKKEFAADLTKSYMKVMDSPGYELLSNRERSGFEEKYEQKLEDINTKNSKKIIENFNLSAEEMSKECRKKIMDKRFNEDIKILTAAMKTKGYSPCKQEETESNQKLHFIFKKKNSSKQVEYWLKKPETENDTIHDFEMKVDKQGFDGNEQERIKEGKAVFNVLRNFGIQLDYLDLGDKISRTANKEILKKHIKNLLLNKGKGNLNVITGLEGSVKIGGITVFTNDLTIEKVVQKYIEASNKTMAASSQREKISISGG